MINSCDTTIFPSAPILTTPGTTYYHGQGNLAVPVQYALDSKLCGGYNLLITLDSAASTITGGPVNPALVTNVVNNPNSFTFAANQPGLSGTLKYNVRIGVNGATAVSPTTVISVDVQSCN